MLMILCQGMRENYLPKQPRAGQYCISLHPLEALVMIRLSLLSTYMVFV